MMYDTHRYPNSITAIVSCFFGVVALLAASCEIPLDPSENPDNVKLSVAFGGKDSLTNDSISVFLGDTVRVTIGLELPDLVDSLMVECGIQSASEPMMCAAGRPPKDTSFAFCRLVPCTLQIAVGALVCNGRRLTDTVTVVFSEHPGSNTAPVLTLLPRRTYATPVLPCTVSVMAVDAEKWQTTAVKLALMPDSARFIGDSLFVWTPNIADTSARTQLVFIASDNSHEALADTDTVVIAVIPDDTPPLTPQECAIVQRRLKNVTLSWNRVLSADYYRIYRNGTPAAFGWDLVDSTSDTTYVDETDQAYYYQVVAVNLFYRSKPTPVIFGKDTLFHGISFPDSTIVFAETDSIDSIPVTLTVPLAETLTVSYEALPDSSTADTTDCLFADSVHVLKFAPGDMVKFIRLKMRDDTVPEYGETFALRLGAPSFDLLLKPPVYRCTIRPDRDSLRQRLKILLVRFYCEMADDEGAVNWVNMTGLAFSCNAVERTADTTRQRVVVQQNVFALAGGEVDLGTGSAWAPATPAFIIVPLDADKYEPSKSIFTFGAYGCDYDPANPNDVGGSTLTLAGDALPGPHSFTMSSPTNWTIRVDFTVAPADSAGVP
jgi:hypothetical protein